MDGQRLLADGRHRVRHREGAARSRSTTTPRARSSTYLRLWDHVGTKLPKRKGKKAGVDAEWVPPDTLEGALRSLYRSYAQSFAQWERDAGASW